MMVGFFAGMGVSAWVYSKIMRSSGGNTQSSIIVASCAGLAAMAAMVVIMNMVS